MSIDANLSKKFPKEDYMVMGSKEQLDKLVNQIEGYNRVETPIINDTMIYNTDTAYIVPKDNKIKDKIVKVVYEDKL